MADALQRELKKYQELLPTLSSDEGKFAVIADDELVGIFESYGDALAAGYQKAVLKPFLVKQIAKTEVIAYFTRDTGSTECHI